ncbi:MAG TPA: VWA domain-containing protein [Gemmataceae bacterium]|nr:VWA domain-containing protein [Gemmataceae bacterium]
MRTRHRMPMIFSLSMMDVFCCTLGCVILLWLANQREARLRARTLAEATEQLTQSRSDLYSADRERDLLRRQLADARTALARARDDAAATQKDLDNTRARADELAKQLADARAEAADTAERLAKKTQAEQVLTRQQADALRRISDLERLLLEQTSHASTAESKATDLNERLALAEARIAQLKKVADTLPELRDAASTARNDADEAIAKLKTLEKDLQSRDRELVEARGALSAAQGGRADLVNQITRLRAATENRFEGIQLTGKRVVFLVDMSGSMELIDDRTPDAAKWPGVRDAVLKIMRSLPQLEKFQVILFSDQATFLLGQPGTWLDYNPTTSPDRVGTALASTKPRGNTNMYAAMEAAFKFRPTGMDTIYLFSDGLPNIGAGLDPVQTRTMKEFERSEILSRHIRTTLKSNWNVTRPTQSKVRINAVGFFYESPEVGAFLWALARENDGSFVGMSRP